MRPCDHPCVQLCSHTPLKADGSCISDPCWNYVEGIDATQAIILDLYKETATNITFRDINFHPYNLGYNATTVICDPDVFNPEDLANLGFVCHDGLYTPIS